MNDALIERILLETEELRPSSLPAIMVNEEYMGAGDSQYNNVTEPDYWATRFIFLLLVLAAEEVEVEWVTT